MITNSNGDDHPNRRAIAATASDPTTNSIGSMPDTPFTVNLVAPSWR
jgi:hypothetical protein